MIVGVVADFGSLVIMLWVIVGDCGWLSVVVGDCGWLCIVSWVIVGDCG